MTMNAFDLHIPEAEFAELAAGMVADEAPRLFALLEEAGEREDGWIIAWGMEFAERAYVVRGNKSASLLLTGSAEQARRLLSRNATVRTIWVDPAYRTTAAD